MTLAPVIRRGRGARSRLGGVPTTLPPPDVAGSRAGQLPLLLDEPTNDRHVTEPLPGVVHVPGWLDLDAQRVLVGQFREWARPPAGLRHPRMPTGSVMSVQSVCLGWHWSPYTYTRTADDTDGAPVKPMPADLVAMSRDAVAAAYGADSPDALTYEPDAALVNLYAPGAKLGLHQDAEELSDAPVVTISIGDACTFRLAAVDRRVGPFVDLQLRSGDLLVFGRANRRIFHGVPKVDDATVPEGTGLPPGRLSITVRQTGLA
ncbi:MAG: alpha-ketoglutarate-dependent dioxygenase AlkB [Actinomycetota bacterium]|nr:alpha-ketoglutarate-dependent dioxygenase AlkB [Actinomycetota bacterium]